MTNSEKDGTPRIRFGPIQWLGNSLRAPIEKVVSEFRGNAWRIKSEKDLSEFACHRCAIVSDGKFDVFFKYNEAADAKQQFEIELSGLQILLKRSGVLIPQPIGIVRVETGTLLIMEALEAVRRGVHQYRQVGVTLSRIHRVKGDSHGFKKNGFCGPLFQDNTPMQNWATFFRDRRLLPRIKIAVDSGNMPTSIVSQIELIIKRLPELCGPEIKPTLLHGDAQQNNFISTVKGTYVIDPAVYYGHPEMDLALIDSFQPVPQAVFDGYRDELSIDSGFSGRRDLWRIPLYLAAVAIEGSRHLNRLTDAIQKYL
jgi:fructosamine-3-kinase